MPEAHFIASGLISYTDWRIIKNPFNSMLFHPSCICSTSLENICCLPVVNHDFFFFFSFISSVSLIKCIAGQFGRYFQSELSPARYMYLLGLMRSWWGQISDAVYTYICTQWVELIKDANYGRRPCLFSRHYIIFRSKRSKMHQWGY